MNREKRKVNEPARNRPRDFAADAMQIATQRPAEATASPTSTWPLKRSLGSSRSSLGSPESSAFGGSCRCSPIIRAVARNSIDYLQSVVELNYIKLESINLIYGDEFNERLTLRRRLRKMGSISWAEFILNSESEFN